MADGVIVPTDKLTSTAQVLKGLSTSASEIQTAMAAADPPGVLWGGLGLLFVNYYNGKADEVREHVGMIAEAFDSQHGAITANADAYTELDQALTDAFNRFQQKLSGGGGK
ncbi:hypothetical protein J2S43_002487 [Catenuloplanes nepalensis]|uniref:ESX-1 secretion-associated protein n=1 Tax=Catenuloplanes nepalensis TaxID=587533 RepID=A0ABT9MRC3_9ACTN|nr:hypothetical protein [Catenuloplanes nepalensis]MDP9793975.1 hypothetical protein [Catenuloplanes nepalensis]